VSPDSVISAHAVYRSGNGRHADAASKDHPHRHGCVLRVCRAAGQPGPTRQTGRRRWLGGARRRGCRELRSPEVRHPIGYGVGDREAAMPRPDLRETALRGLQGDQPSDPRDLRRAYRDHRASVTRRGLSRRHRKPPGHSAGARRRAADPPKNQGRDRPQRLGGHQLQQILGEACLRLCFGME
jgi:hypothetical protein